MLMRTRRTGQRRVGEENEVSQAEVRRCRRSVDAGGGAFLDRGLSRFAVWWGADAQGQGQGAAAAAANT